MLLNIVMFKVTICDFGKMNINMTDKIEKKEATFAVPYNGEDNNDYVDGKGFCCNDGSLEAAQTRALARAAKNNFQEDDAYEKMQFYYHPDHLGSSSYITNLDGEVVQHIEYVPFGEVFVEERNNIWNTPYLFNAKEFDEETGLYYYGARYYDPKVSLWISPDPIQEKYPNKVKEVRGTGLLLGMELVKKGSPIVESCLADGLIVNCTAEKVIRLVPPLIVTEAEIDKAVAILDKALTKF